MAQRSHRVGLDIGGTFTDFVLYDAERRRISLYKCLTTPDDPSVAALEGFGIEIVDQVPVELNAVEKGKSF